MDASHHDLLRPLADLSLPAWVRGPALAAVLASLLFALRRLLLHPLAGLAARTSNTVDDLLRGVPTRTKAWSLLALSVAAGAAALPLTPPTSRLVQIVGSVGIGLPAGLWFTTLLVGLVRRGISETRASGALDPPFEVGDFLIADNPTRTAEQVGIKTPPGPKPVGEWRLVSSSNLLNARIRTRQRMRARRVMSPLGVVYFVLDPDCNRAMDIPQRIKLALLERLAGEGFELAYPTRARWLPRAPTSPLQGATP